MENQNLPTIIEEQAATIANQHAMLAELAARLAEINQEREVLKLKPKTKQPNLNQQGAVVASAKAAKVTLVIEPASISRLDSMGKKAMRVVIQVANDFKLSADLNSKSYRKALAAIDALGTDNCLAILQGSMTKQGLLEGVGLVVQAKKAKEEQATTEPNEPST